MTTDLIQAPAVGTKTCTKCGIEKELDEFSLDKNGRFGRRTDCKACRRAYGKFRQTEINATNARISIDVLRERTPFKTCSKCKAVLPSTEFSRGSSQKSGLRGECKSCETIQGSLWAKVNPEKARAKTARRRAKEKGLFLEDFTYTQIVERDGAEACAYCHTTEGPFDVDHVFPLNLGGWHTPDNLVLACANHNRSKGAVHPAIYVTREGFTPNRAVLRALAMERELICLSIKEDALCA